MRNSQTLLAFRHNLHLLHCPVCKEQMSLCEEHLKCTNGHSYDLSRQGYVNLVNYSVKTKYGRQLFKSRKTITQIGIFKPLVDILGLEIIKRKNNCKSLSIIDAGCGEGTLFHQLKELLYKNNIKTNAIGFDISKEGIKLASSDYKDILWMVANLADLPVADSSADVIINLLAPANYTQFRRLLAPGGILIKVIPGKEYLKELRSLFSAGKSAPDNSGSKAISLFEKNFRTCGTTHIIRKINVDDEILPDLLKMTPLMWNIKDKKINSTDLRELTMDLYVLSGYVDTK